jgi:diguanylate cyclase (GGDEF)-like protein/PAS domain S-box-containing protein
VTSAGASADAQADAEAERLARLRELLVLDSPPEALFDGIARLASEICAVPIALLSLVDAERQWFKANVGLTGVNETPRDVAFCAHAIHADGLFEVPDARADPRFAANPLVTGTPDIRFYAGVPLTLPEGQRVGTLCVIDREVRRLNDSQARALQALAGVATQALVMRRDLITRSLSVRSEFEQALAASETRHRAIVEDQAELVSLARGDGTLVYVNPAYARQFGLVPNQMIGANLFDYVEPGDRDAVRALVAGVLQTGVNTSGENRMVAADGVERWVAWTNRLQQDTDGRLLLHSVGRDVTERKRIEQALRASQAFLARTGRVAGVGGWEVDLASSAVTWSDETRRLHEVGADYVPTIAGGIEFYAPEARDAIETAVQAGMHQGRPWDLELPLITATGRRIWVRAQGEVEFEQGKPARLVGALQDITERKLLQQRLTENERFVRQVTDSLPLRIAYVDKELRYRFVNRVHCERFGRARDEVIGRTRSELTGVPMEAEFESRVRAVLAGEPQRFEYVEPVGGRARRIESQLIPDLADDGEVRGFFSTGIDITERAAAERALRELTAIFDNTTDYVLQTDRRGNIVYMNPAARQANGYTPDEPLTHRNVAELNTPATRQRMAETILPEVKARGVWVGETTMFVAGGREITVSHLMIAHRDRDGHVDRYSSMMRDISAEIEAERQQQRQAATLRSVAEAMPAIVAVVGSDRRYRFVNSGFERWIGAPRESIVGRTLAEVLGRADHDRSKPWVERVLQGETVRFERSYPGRTDARHLALTYVPLWLDSGEVDGFVGVAQDITQHKQEELRLRLLTQQDPLTGLLNRAGFEQHLEARLLDGSGPGLALLYIDLDRFKPVNDSHGHPVGDQVLQLFAQRLRTLVRPTDAVARLGGDEFAIVLAGLREGVNARAVADKVIAAAHAPFDLGTLQVRIGASVGVAYGADPAIGWPDLLARADAMLYRAKESGRGRQAGTSRM